MARQALKNICRLIEEATKALPVQESFVADLNAAIEKVETANKRAPSKSYKPSSLNCIRNMYFQIVGAEQDEERASAALIGICESGTDRHLRIQNAISKMKDIGIDCEYIDVSTFIKMRQLADLEVVSVCDYETKLFHKKLNLRFMCDGIIKYKSQYYILEIKTASIYKWQGQTDVMDNHLLQGTCYCLCFGIDQVMFLYENRDNCIKKAYVLNVTDDMKYSVISKIEECDSYVSKLIPPPKPDIEKKECNYCAYKTACKKAGS